MQHLWKWYDTWSVAPLSCFPTSASHILHERLTRHLELPCHAFFAAVEVLHTLNWDTLDLLQCHT
jgi:hypothetical protein